MRRLLTLLIILALAGIPALMLHYSPVIFGYSFPLVIALAIPASILLHKLNK